MSLRQFFRIMIRFVLLMIRVVLLTVVAFIVYALVYWQIEYAPIAFDAKAWRAGDSAEFSSHTPRLRMVDELVDNGVLLGKTRTEIEAMLGPPTDSGYFKNYDLVYWLGAERGFFMIDSEWLVLRLDASGYVNEASIVRD